MTSEIPEEDVRELLVRRIFRARSEGIQVDGENYQRKKL